MIKQILMYKQQKEYEEQNKNDNKKVYKGRNLQLEQDDDQQDEQDELKQIIKNCIKQQYIRKLWRNIDDNIRQEIIKQIQEIMKQIPKQLYQFVNNSILIHKSELSTVFIGLTKLLNINQQQLNQSKKVNKQQINTKNNEFQQEKNKVKQLDNQQHYQQQDKRFLLNSQICILKINNNRQFQTTNKINKLINHNNRFQKYNLKYNQNYGQKELIIDKFRGFSLYLIMKYFLQYKQISLDIIDNLIDKLKYKIKQLHHNHIIHGDISLNNILLQYQPHSTINSFNQYISHSQYNSSYQLTKTQSILISSIQNQLYYLINSLFNSNITYPNYQSHLYNISIHIIDFGNSFISYLQSIQNIYQLNQNILNQLSTNCPTQTIHYRSPQALYQRGSYPIDIWGMGHIVFTLLTGTSIFPLQEQFNQSQLQQIFQNQQSFICHIQNQITKLRYYNQSETQIFNSIKQLILKCLKINPKQRLQLYPIKLK